VTIPEVVAFPLEEAQTVLAEAGVTQVLVCATSPPRGGPPGPMRIIRQRILSEGVELVATPTIVLKQKEPDHD
jgi:hypothetical protein